jgi:hypothetical protein
MRLDDGVFRVPLDLLLEFGDHMAGRDDEAARVEAHGLVLSATKRDQSIAAELPALAAERDDSIGRFGVNALVERAEGHLVACHAHRVHLNAGCVAEEIHRPRPMVPPRRNTRRACVGFHRRSVLAAGSKRDSPRLAAPVSAKREAHVHTGADFALDDQELVAELRHEAESNPKAGAVIARGHSDAIVADEDPDALFVLGQP